MAKTRSAKRDVDSYTIKGTNLIVKVGDSVLMHPPDTSKLPYVARVEKIENDNRNSVNVRIRWYYRPEDSIGGRRQFHGTNELFLSDHYDVQSAHTIEGKCVVHPFDDYIKLAKVGSEDYFCRFEYMAATGTFTPDSVAVYCKCEMPYNPDAFMMQCERCQDWYHLACIGMTAEEANKLEHYVCSECSSDDDLNKSLPPSSVSPTIHDKEKLDAKTLPRDGIAPAIEEPCDNLHGDQVSKALECVTPGMDPLSLPVNNVESVNVEGVQVDAAGEEEKTDKERVDDEHKSIEDQGHGEEPILGHGDGQVPTNDIIELQKNDTKMTNPESMERKRKQPMETTMMNHHNAENLEEMGGPIKQAPAELDGSTHTTVNNVEAQVDSAKRVMDVLNNMDGLEAGSSLWCNAVYLLEDPVKRVMFLRMKHDASRLAWINFRCQKDK
ncbi:hypothetical protein Lal_00023290 [Lupinus albus]|uniref:Putative chromatin regulator PHD family n=1 Tax=Lupinus albus TaxID=3870 RepID=A0A6A5N208_LUPAL|nr:putative chromatin regulator PHD family [Lupinus albus]KAF1881254.1 hypothetical protein Lal_00023290 [Lupinus albus]